MSNRRHLTDADISGKVFGRLTLVGFVSPFQAGEISYAKPIQAVCQCGRGTQVKLRDLSGGKTKSCGCMKAETLIRCRTKHGKNLTPSHRSWLAMMNRHHGLIDPELYRDRGIKVCKRWHDFVKFYEDMGERPQGMSLDRVNNSRGYSLKNCRWATPKQQSRNRRSCLRVKYEGKTWLLCELIDERSTLKPTTVMSRIKRGWSVEKSLKTPLRSELKA